MTASSETAPSQASENAGGKRLVVIGGGTGGYPAAFFAAEHGFDVTLVNDDPDPGGVCLYRGCIPSKALLHVAALIYETERAAEWGIRWERPSIDVDQLRGFKDQVISRLTRGLASLAKQRHVKYLQGRGAFVDPRTVRVERADGGSEDLTFDFAVIATGSSPARVPGLELDSPAMLDSTSALEIADIPETLLVVGGGYIGLELGTVYDALGSQVTVVEMTSNLLAGADRDLVEPLAKSLQSRFEQILLDSKVAGLEAHPQGVKARLLGAGVAAPERVFSKVLVAVGRRPNSRNIGLENTRVEVDGRGFVKTDLQRRTAEPAIFAVGDVAGEPMLAHKATHEARVAVEAMAGLASAWEPAAIPAVVFTDPEIAWAGLTETEARNRGVEYEVAKFPWTASGRATTLGRNEGLTKLLVQPGTERILGVGIVGAGAGELIAEGTLAIEMGAVATDLSHTIHAHPTLSETLMEAAETLFGTSPHYASRGRRRGNTP